MFIPYIVFCEKCGSYYELEEDESVLDFTDSKCSCGGSLKFARSMEEMDETLSKLSSSNNGNLLTRYWNGLNTKRKIKIISGLFLILLAIIIISTGILSPKVTQVTSTPQSGEFPRMLSNANVSGIEVRIITNSSWQGISSIYYQNGSETEISYVGGEEILSGAGSQSFSINGNPTNLNIQIQKLNYDLNDLTVQLLVNGTVVESESTGQDSDAVIFNYDFDPYDGF